MKGIVFTEFIEMVEQDFSYELADKLLSNQQLESEGVFTAVGTYPHSDMVKMVVHLSQESKMEVPALLKHFGRYLFDTFLKNYPDFFNSTSDSFKFLESIENHIHVEVLKLYPEAQLPTFETENLDNKKMKMVYSSDRKMADFALGLIEKTMEHYKEDVTILQSNLVEDGSKVLFTITRN